MKIALLEPLNVSEEMLREMAAPVLERGHELTVYDTKADSPQEVIRRAQGMDAVIIANEAVICGLTPEKACNFKEFAA